MKRFGKITLVGVLFLLVICGISSIAIAEVDTTQAVSFKNLIKYLPDAPSGWEGEDPDGMTFTVQEGSWSMATKSYSKSGSDDITADVTITDYAAYILGWQGAWGTHYSWESTDGYAKTTKVKGYPAWEMYDKDSNEYMLSISINDRFLVLVTTDGDKNTLDTFANSVDYKGIASLGGSASSTIETESTGSSEEAETEKEPGFGAIFAVSGLLAVAYIIKRRG